jgi:hypothetical protein
VCSIVGGIELKSLEQLLSEIELSLVTVQDVIERNADGSRPEDSYIGVNLGLYVQHTQAVIRRGRWLLECSGGRRP